ncbi:MULTISPECIES: Gfo/Idh/MocA family protein [unclassified Streptomyces]|uniref:Gfo/Idh/MocA family protein n=1 Tax=unclassified Streptomyces TaxID=2593676 RepID=UPI0022B68424|nr:MULTISPECIES: Gfo/Idh/MocA family oxidoreductase [unclassified Streptomyces]MCZ7415889.1 Gfo/Idh/MocA family oxidoreductase [Streptomyces sp. WMMC897]MCZ7434302.1 Gfo/Idh/MocA family oxidoreductase [Streptomyces sp. WMMC1477]
MRIGLIGTGRIGALHAHNLSELPGVTELLLVDAEHGRAAAVAAETGAKVLPSSAELFAARPDAVVIASATASHPGLITRAARAGVPAFCEKPVAADLPGTRAALAEVARAGTVLQIGFMRRFDAGYAAAREAVRAGRLGRLHTVRTLTADPAPPPAGYLPLSGGIFRDCLVHDFDALRWVTGREVVSVYATGSDAGPPMFRQADDVDTAAALLTLDDGTLVTATGTRMNGAGYDVRMELAGERDQIAVGLGPRTPLGSAEPDAAPRRAVFWQGFLDRFAPAFRAELAAFLDVVRGRRDNPCEGAEALRALRVAEACEASRRSGRPIAP